MAETDGGRVMETDALVEMAQEAMKSRGLSFVQADIEPEVYEATDVYGSIGGKDVILHFTETRSGSSAYHCNLQVIDSGVDPQLATGNGASDWDQALAIVHWQDVEAK